MYLSTILTNDDRSNHFSFELMAPKSESGTIALIDKLKLINETSPRFFSVSMHDFDQCVALQPHSSLVFASRLQSLFLCPVVLHLTCVGKTQQIYGDLLTNIFKMGIRNLLIVRGDNYTKALSKEDPVQHPCFKSPLELLAFIRCKFADCFCIGVPVYPSIVTDPDRMQQSIDLLQEKIRLGAGFAITQALIDHNQFGAFVSELRNRNIYLPVVGGLLPITSAKSYQTVKSFGKASLQILNEPQIQACNDDDDSICEVSLAAHVRLAAECLRNQQTNLLHIFTLNHIEIAHRLVIAAAQPDTIF